MLAYLTDYHRYRSLKTGVFFKIIMIFCLSLFSFIAVAAEKVPPAGRIINFTGHVRIIPVQGGAMVVPAIGQELNTGSMVLTGRDG